MRVQAKDDFPYRGVTISGGAIFDVPHEQGLDLINRDLVIPFNLEDPNQRSESYDLSQPKSKEDKRG